MTEVYHKKGYIAIMTKEKKTVTNVMRLLEKAGIPYDTREYEYDESDLSGVHAAQVLGLDPDMVFKTLVLRGERTGWFVCVVPAAYEVDLKKAAAVTGDKKCDLIAVKELLPLTGYIRGGCSPVGMKKQFPTYIDETATLQETISVSAGQRGVQVLVAPQALADYTGARFADLI